MKSPPAHGTRHRSPNARHGLLAGLLVVALGGAAVWWFVLRTPADSNIQKSQQSTIHRIAETPPAKAKPHAPEVKKPGRKLDPNSFAAKLKSGKVFTNELGYVYNLPTDPRAKTNYLTVAENEYLRKHFKNDLDYHLANLISTEPGEDIIGDLPHWYKTPAFAREFKRSMNEPIIINENDPEDIKDLKRALMDSKQDIFQRLNKGENVGELIQESFREMQNLGLYREELEKQVDGFSRDKSLTAEEIEDFVAAANKMLAERGIAPMKMPRVAAARFRYLKNCKKNKE